MIKRSAIAVFLALAHLNAVVGGGFADNINNFLSASTRELLATRFRKAKIERKVAYEGTPLLVLRGIKSSHKCWMQCKKNPECSRFTYIPGEWKKCKLYRKGDRSVRKFSSRHTISGYADWRISVKNWGKKKPAKKNKKGKNKNKNNKGASDAAYEDPNASYEDPNASYEDPNATAGDLGCQGADCNVGEPGSSSSGDASDNSDDVAYEDPSMGSEDWDMGSPVSGYYSLMTGKTVYGRRINSILPCVGNIARRYTDCRDQCRVRGNCSAWTWASFDCSWVGDSTDTGICYLMTDTDTDNVFEAPNDGDFISGLTYVRGSVGSGSSDGAYEDPNVY